jgi:hypothetical protein
MCEFGCESESAGEYEGEQGCEDIWGCKNNQFILIYIVVY